jgi:hypothetical protein
MAPAGTWRSTSNVGGGHRFRFSPELPFRRSNERPRGRLLLEREAVALLGAQHIGRSGGSSCYFDDCWLCIVSHSLRWAAFST